ncbi:MAG: glycosyltransferase family 2 protein [Pigmentiphaga sp.]
MTILDSPIDASLCICTYKRPALLRALLEAIARQDTGGLNLEIVVADNDPAGSANATLEELTSRLPLPLVSHHVPTPNIALARNATVHAARGNWVIFVDDDEEPEPGWIIALLHTQRAHQADVVFGPILPRYGPRFPAWIRRGGFFERPRYPSGTRVGTDDARAGNALVRRSLLLEHPGPFDAAYGRTGGEDTLLFRQLQQRGAIFVWCDEAIVSEEVPADRATLPWLLRRSYRGGQSFIRSELHVRAGFPRLMRALVLGGRALIQLLIAALLALACLPFSRIRSATWLRTSAAQLGKLSSLAGHRYQEYRH